MPLNPISFCIPEEKIVDTVPNKTKSISIITPCIPGNAQQYKFNNEAEYYNEYKESFFAVTLKKAGWDCMRHYEILANGCIPYFPSIGNCPVNTMTTLPKDLMLEANNLFEQNCGKSIDKFTNDEKIKCYELIIKLLKYTRQHLTTRKLASYILEKSNHKAAYSVLYLSGDTSPDYMRDLLLIGFKQLLGSKCHDFPIIPFVYKNNMDCSNLYGRGITYAKNLDTNLHDFELDKNVESDIINRKYNIIIYGSHTRGMPYYDLVETYYRPHEVIILNGEDNPNLPYGIENPTIMKYDYWEKKGHHVFVREL